MRQTDSFQNKSLNWHRNLADERFDTQLACVGRLSVGVGLPVELVKDAQHILDDVKKCNYLLKREIMHLDCFLAKQFIHSKLWDTNERNKPFTYF